MNAKATDDGAGAQTARRGASRPTISTILTGALAAFNLFLAITPQLGILFLALVGGLGVASVAMDYVKLPWARYLSIGAAIISFTTAVSAIASSLMLYPLIRGDVVQFLSINLINLLYLSISITSLAASLRRE